MGLVAEISGVLRESSAAALGWPALREHVAGRCSSPLGRGWVLSLEPSTDVAWIAAQQARTDAVRGLLRGGVVFSFAGLFDPTELLEKARVEGSALEAAEILQVLHLAQRLAAWRGVMVPGEGRGGSPGGAVLEMSAAVVEHDWRGLLRALEGKIEPDGTLSDDASPELRRIRRAMERQHRVIEEVLRKSLRTLSAEGSAQDELITVRNERFVIPVKTEYRRRVPGVVHGGSSSGQTVFVEPLEAMEQNNELIRLLDEEQGEIHRILRALTAAIGAEAGALLAGAEVLAEVESHFARGRFAEEFGCVRPVFLVGGLETRVVTHSKYGDSGAALQNDGPSHAVGSSYGERLELVEARHPLLELRLKRAGQAGPVPLTVALEDEARQLIVSGPNTGGKTVTLKTVGLLALMALAGMPVPAERAVLPVFDAVYADIGDAQSIEQNLSSFSAHMVNVNRIARESDTRSLVLLDELGSATDPEEGAALAVAIAGRFLEMRAWTVITTHLTSLKVYAASRPGVLNAAVGFDPATLAPTYRLRLGVPGASAGINIAERLGLDAGIVAAARGQMTTQTADIAALLDSLHDQLAVVAAEREAIALKERELARERLRLEVEGRAEQRARTKELEAKLDSLLDDFEGQVREIVKGIGDKSLAQRIQRDALTRKARAKREVTEEFRQTVVAHNTGADKGDPNAQPHLRGARELAARVAAVKMGDTVTVKSLGRPARVERVFEPKAAAGAREFEVSAGLMKMRVAAGDISDVTVGQTATPLQEARRRGGITVQTAYESDDVPMEINVIGKTADEAQDEVARFVDRAFLAGLPGVRIVHGTGMGILRRTLRDYLKRHPNVVEVTEPAYNQGGQGATEVRLRQ
ncbi:MAG: endonuclease MutS2 [Acidobacteriaceae bacterium]